MDELNSISCPGCGERITYAFAAAGKLQCSRCGNDVVIPAKTPPCVIIVTPKADAPAPAEAAPPPTLGKEPAPAAYGLLQIFAWLLLISTILGCGWLTYEGLETAVTPRPGTTTSSFAPLETIHYVLNYGWEICFALVGLLLVRKIELLDRAGGWLAWRSGGLSGQIPEPRGSTLPYILPWTVCGGLAVIVSIMLFASEKMTSDSSRAPGSELILGGAGIIVFFLGLALGEVRRFFWRMENFARALPRHTRGAELGFSVPRERTRRSSTNSPLFVAFAGACVVLVSLLSYTRWLSVFRITSKELQWCVGVVGWLGVGGGVFSLFSLARDWSRMLLAWEEAAETVGGEQQPLTTPAGTRRFTLFSRSIAFLFFVVQLVLLTTIPGKLPAKIYVAALTTGALFIAFLGCVDALKQECSRWTHATTAFGAGSTASTALLKIFRVLTAAVLVSSLVLLIPALAAATSRGMSPDYEAVFRLGTALGTLIVIGMMFLPAYWLALVATDLEQIGTNLEKVQDTSPRP